MACSVVVTQEGKYGRGPEKFACSRCGRDFGWLDKEPQGVACRVEEEELAARRASDEDIGILLDYYFLGTMALDRFDAYERLGAAPWLKKVSEL